MLEEANGGGLEAGGPRRGGEPAGNERLDFWEAPIAIEEVPAAAAFPVEALPPVLRAFVGEAAGALDCPMDYLGPPLLVLSGAAIGASRALRVKESWEERPALYVAIVGPPGSAKSPALKLTAGPVYEVQARLLAEHQAVLDRYDEQQRAYEAWQKKAAGSPWADPASPLHDLVMEWEKPVAKPEPPVLARLYAADSTIEALAPLLAENRRGLALIRDELAGWVTALSRSPVERGRERQFYLSAWAGEPICVDRKGQRGVPTLVARPFLSVVGGLTPDLLSVLGAERGRADGFLDRILFAYPEAGPPGQWKRDAVSEIALEGWKETLERLRRLAPGPDGLACFNREGEAAWARFFDAQAEEVRAEGFPEFLRAPWAKMRGYAARLALILHYLWNEDGGNAVGGDSVERAGRVLDYFKAHARKVYACMDAGRDGGKTRCLLNWLRRHIGEGESFSKADAYRANRANFSEPDALERPLSKLCQLRHIRPLPAPLRQGPGRRATPRYEVNPQSRQ